MQIALGIVFGLLLGTSICLAVALVNLRRAARTAVSNCPAVRDASPERSEYLALLACSEAAVILLTEENLVDRANPAARYLFSAAGAPIGRTLAEVTDSPQLVALVAAARESGTLQRDEAPIGQGSSSFVRAAVAPVSGQPGRFILVAQDVSELRRLETVRRDFVANVSHELRTPLASIRAMAETLQDGAIHDSSVADHFIQTINNEAQRLTRISEDLLVLSQAESRLPEKAPLALTELITSVVDRFDQQAERACLALQSEIPFGLEVLANHDQIEQVLVNLVDNALKYTPAGGRVSISAERRLGDVAVLVADTGIGIMSQDLPRIFERFYRVDKHRSRQSGGTGLGLSIVKHIVEAHGGQVTVDSAYNRGSTFTFTLPALTH